MQQEPAQIDTVDGPEWSHHFSSRGFAGGASSTSGASSTESSFFSSSSPSTLASAEVDAPSSEQVGTPSSSSAEDTTLSDTTEDVDAINHMEQLSLDHGIETTPAGSANLVRGIVRRERNSRGRFSSRIGLSSKRQAIDTSRELSSSNRPVTRDDFAEPETQWRSDNGDHHSRQNGASNKNFFNNYSCDSSSASALGEFSNHFGLAGTTSSSRSSRLSLYADRSLLGGRRKKPRWLKRVTLIPGNAIVKQSVAERSKKLRNPKTALELEMYYRSSGASSLGGSRMLSRLYGDNYEVGMGVAGVPREDSDGGKGVGGVDRSRGRRRHYPVEPEIKRAKVEDLAQEHAQEETRAFAEDQTQNINHSPAPPKHTPPGKQLVDWMLYSSDFGTPQRIADAPCSDGVYSIPDDFFPSDHIPLVTDFDIFIQVPKGDIRRE
ncbi:unnamed protein product [Amoebophrya sp. A25]|nr:unnamed protein product [Amoebophrya sp. A25]|eukprot:GSA25T00001235001.1